MTIVNAQYESTFSGCTLLCGKFAEKLRYMRGGGLIHNPVPMFLPQTPEQMKLNELSSRTGQLIERIAASRITELEITRSLFGMFLGGEAANTLDDDVAQLRAILEGGKRPPDCDPLK